MVDGTEVRLDLLQDIRIRGDIEAGKVFATDDDGLHGIGGEDITDALIGRHGNFLVTRVDQPIGVDERMVVHVGRLNGDVAAGKGRNQGGLDGAEIVAVRAGARV